MAALVSKEKPTILNNLEFPTSTAWSERETPKFVNDINNTFEFNTSMMERLGLYVLFLNINKLKPIVEIIIKYYNKKNDTQLNLKVIEVALQKLNESSNVPFIKGGDGNTNHIKNIIKMLMWLIGEIIFLVCISNSLMGKVDNSIAINAFKKINDINTCKHKNELVPPLKYIRGNFKGYSVYDNSVLETAISVWECSNIDNVIEVALEENFKEGHVVERREEYMATGNKETTQKRLLELPAPDDNNGMHQHEEEYMEFGNEETTQKHLALAAPDNNNGMQQQFNDNILVAFNDYVNEYNKDKDLTDEKPEDKYKIALALYDSIIYPKGVDNNDDDVNINSVISWFGTKILHLSENALNSLKEGKINPVFWQDIMPQLKVYAKLKKAELMHAVDIKQIEMEQAVDELYSILIHISIVYFSTLRVFYKTIFIFNYIAYLYNKKDNKKDNDNLLENKEVNDNEDDPTQTAADALLLLANTQPKNKGGKSKKNKGGKSKKNKGGKSKKNKGGKSKKNKGGKSKKNKTKKN